MDGRGQEWVRREKSSAARLSRFLDAPGRQMQRRVLGKCTFFSGYKALPLPRVISSLRPRWRYLVSPPTTVAE